MGSLRHSIPAILEKRDIWIAILIATTIFAFSLNYYGILRGISSITSHLFYLPIVIAAYWFPRRGVLYTVALAMGYLAMGYLMSYPDVDALTQITTQFYVFVAIGVIVASLSGTLKEQEDRYHGIFDYSEAGVFLLMNLRSGLVIEEVNQKGADILGYRNRDLPGRFFLDLFPDVEERDRFWGMAAPGGAVTDLECQLMNTDGVPRRILLSAGPLPGRKMVVTLIDITERKRAENALRESKERYQGLFNNAQVGLVRTRISDGGVLEANEQMARMFGYESVREFIREFLFPEHYIDPGARDRLLSELEKNGSIANFEAGFTRRDGSIIWARFWARIFPENGYLEQVFTDVTDEKHSHRALTESEERYRQLVDALPDYVLVYGNDRILYANPSVASAVGKGYEEILNTSIFDYISPESWGIVQQNNRRRMQGERVDPYEIRIRTRESFPRTVIVNAAFITFQGEPATLAVLTDITERKKVEEALKASKHQYMTTIDAMIDGIYLVDRELRLVLVNSNFRRWLAEEGVTGDLIGQRIDLLCASHPSESLAGLREVFSTGKSLESREDLSFGGRRYDFEIRRIPVFQNGNVVRVVVIMRNITRQRQIEEEKRIAYEQIEKNIEQFAILGDHLRNPMQVIVGLADLEGGAIADRIHQQAREIDRTIDQLDRGWIESEKIREFIRKY
jgi:PAS domain S-box-containing protein